MQISQYLTCPRRYRHRYLYGWKEEDTRAVMLFGRHRTSSGSRFSSEDDRRIELAPSDVGFACH